MINPKLYEKGNNFQRRDACDTIKEFAPKLNWNKAGDDSLIDIGCGSGDVLVDFVLPILPTTYSKVVGADISGAMVDYAKAKYNIPRLEFEVMDISSESLSQKATGRYDHATSFYCLNWVPQQRQSVKNIYNLLKPFGDCLILQVGCSKFFDIYDEMSETFPKWFDYMTDRVKFAPPLQRSKMPEIEFKQFLQDAGFKNVHSEIRNCNGYFDGWRGEFKAFSVAVNPFLTRIPTLLHDEFYDDLHKTIKLMGFIEEKDNVHELDQIINIPYTKLIAHAKK